MFLLLPLHYLHYLQCFAACVTCHVTRTWNEAINLVTSNYVICWTAVNTENVSWWFQHFKNQWLEGNPSLLLTIENGLGSSSVVKFKFKFNRFLSPVLHHQPSYIFTEAFGIIHFTFCFVLHQIFRLECEWDSRIFERKKIIFPRHVVLCE